MWPHKYKLSRVLHRAERSGELWGRVQGSGLLGEEGCRRRGLLHVARGRPTASLLPWRRLPPAASGQLLLQLELAEEEDAFPAHVLCQRSHLAAGLALVGGVEPPPERV